MQIIRRGEVTKYAFDARDEPVLHVKQEESFQIETDDALSGLIEDDSDNPKVHQFVGDAHVDALNAAYPPKYNPVVGSIYVEGCEAGDVLAVNLEFIDPWRYGFSGILPGIGPLRRVVALGRTVRGAEGAGHRAPPRTERQDPGRQGQVLGQAHLGPGAVLRNPGDRP